MKMVEMHYRYGTMCRTAFRDNDLADSVYAKIKSALQDYREYGNDKAGTVSFNHEHGEQTIKLADLASVVVHDVDAAEDFDVEIAVRNKRIQDRIQDRITAADASLSQK